MEGWTCPRCGQTNAPWVAQCTCPPRTVMSSSTNLQGFICPRCGTWHVGVHYCTSVAIS